MLFFLRVCILKSHCITLESCREYCKPGIYIILPSVRCWAARSNPCDSEDLGGMSFAVLGFLLRFEAEKGGLG